MKTKHVIITLILLLLFSWVILSNKTQEAAAWKQEAEDYEKLYLQYEELYLKYRAERDLQKTE